MSKRRIPIYTISRDTPMATVHKLLKKYRAIITFGVMIGPFNAKKSVRVAIVAPGETRGATIKEYAADAPTLYSAFNQARRAMERAKK